MTDYVNIAHLINTDFRCLRPAKLRTKHETKIAIHPSSVNADEKEFESHWMLYHLKMKTAKVCPYHCLMRFCTCVLWGVSILFYVFQIFFEHEVIYMSAEMRLFNFGGQG